MGKEKEKLINEFEQSFKKKEKLDANQLIQELFPEGQELSANDSEMKEKIEKLVKEMNKKNKNEKGENSKNSNQEKK